MKFLMGRIVRLEDQHILSCKNNRTVVIIIRVCDFDTIDCYALNKDVFDDKIPIELDKKVGIVKMNGTIYV